MNFHDWINLVSIVAVALGGVIGYLAKRTIDRLDEDVRDLAKRLRDAELKAIEQAGEVKAAHELAERVDSALARLEGKLDRLLGLTSTPHGLTRSQRDGG